MFESSEAHEKRLLLKMALQNLELKGKKAQYDWIKPFDKIAFYASRQAWLPLKDLFCNRKLGLEVNFESFMIFIYDLKIYFIPFGPCLFTF